MIDWGGAHLTNYGFAGPRTDMDTVFTNKAADLGSDLGLGTTLMLTGCGRLWWLIAALGLR